MPITTKHPEYEKCKPRWDKMADALADEDEVKAKGVAYLRMTGGMKKNEQQGRDDYDDYKMRARFPEITTQALTGMVGLIFENEPIGLSDEIITNSGQTNGALARDVTRALASKGRDILVVDAPRVNEDGSGGGNPFIARYPAESLINWKVDEKNPSEIILAVFQEEEADADDDEYGHETKTVYRKYQRVNGVVEVSRWAVVNGTEIIIDPPMELQVDFMPIVAVGSIDLTPSTDPIPLLPVARCAFAYYRKSATYESALYLSGSPTPTIAGVSEEQYDAIREQGIGPGSVWWLGEHEQGKAAFLESDGASIGEQRTAMQDELSQAETYAVRLTQNDDTPESGTALALRATAQHASIYTIADSVGLGITLAQNMRAEWGATTAPEPLVLDTEFEPAYAAEQIITALNNAINSGNAPRSPMFEAIRKAGLSEADDETMQKEIDSANAGIGVLEED